MVAFLVFLISFPNVATREVESHKKQSEKGSLTDSRASCRYMESEMEPEIFEIGIFFGAKTLPPEVDRTERAVVAVRCYSLRLAVTPRDCPVQQLAPYRGTTGSTPARADSLWLAGLHVVIYRGAAPSRVRSARSLSIAAGRGSTVLFASVRRFHNQRGKCVALGQQPVERVPRLV